MHDLHIEFSGARLLGLSVPDVSCDIGECDGSGERAGDGQGVGESACRERSGVAILDHGGETIFLRSE